MSGRIAATLPFPWLASGFSEAIAQKSLVKDLVEIDDGAEPEVLLEPPPEELVFELLVRAAAGGHDEGGHERDDHWQSLASQQVHVLPPLTAQRLPDPGEGVLSPLVRIGGEH